MKLKFLIRHLPENTTRNRWIYGEGIPFIATSNKIKSHRTRHDLETLYFGGKQSREELSKKAPRLIIYEYKKL